MSKQDGHVLQEIGALSELSAQRQIITFISMQVPPNFHNILHQLLAKPRTAMGVGGSTVLVLAAAVWLMRGLDWAALALAIASADARWLAAAALSVGLSQLARVLRWRVLLPGADTAWSRLAWAVLGAQVINWLSPVRVGELWRAWTVAGREPLAWWNVGRSIVAEKAMDAALLSLMALWLAGSDATAIPAVARVAAAVLALALLFVASRALRSGRVLQWVSRLWPQAAAQRGLRAQLPPLRAGAIARAGLLTVAVWGIGGITNVLVARALGWEMTPIQVVAFMLAAQIGISAAAVPANLGVFSVAALAVLPALGVTDPQAAAFGVLLYALVYVVQGGLAGVAWGWGRLTNRRLNPADVS